MKKLILVLTINLFAVSNIYSQTGWFQQSCPNISYFETVFFPNELTGFASGGWPILKTTNGGTNWIVSYLPDTTSKIYSIRFLNNTTGYACGGRELTPSRTRQYLFKTTNTGETWFKVYEESSTESAEYFKDVFPIDNLVYLTRGGYDTLGAKGGVLLSQNSGANFTNIFLTIGETIEKLSFINSQTGWVTTLSDYDLPLTKRKIFKTTNHGLNWTMQFRDSSVRNYWSNPNFELQFINENTGYGLYNVFATVENITKFIKTTNGGLTWDSTIFSPKIFEALFFLDANTGWIGGNSTLDGVMIMRTTNAGVNWQAQNTNPNAVFSIFFVNNLTGWAVGHDGLILKTITGGVTGVQNISTTISSKYSLSQNYPNPFNPITNIIFEIPQLSSVNIAVFDALGRAVETLVNEQLHPGSYSVDWNAAQYPSGVYFYRLQTEGYSETRKMLLTK